MTEKRIKNLVLASVSTAVVFLVILLAVLVFQWVAITRAKKQEALLDQMIKDYEMQYEYYDEEIKLWNEQWKIIEEARKLGYKGK